MNDFYRTSDIALASTLTIFQPLLMVDKTNPRRSEFCFEPTTEINNLTNKYWRGELKVEPQQYFAKLKFLKSTLYSETPYETTK